MSRKTQLKVFSLYRSLLRAAKTMPTKHKYKRMPELS